MSIPPFSHKGPRRLGKKGEMFIRELEERAKEWLGNRVFAIEEGASLSLRRLTDLSPLHHALCCPFLLPSSEGILCAFLVPILHQLCLFLKLLYTLSALYRTVETLNETMVRAKPGGVATFDEESCRFFLQQVAVRVVPFYPFSVGIEEVYSLLLEQYGEGNVADAMSVLHELLEDDNNASGIGDDGDAWRSWRHEWRHRNDNSLQPSSPRVGEYIFPPPTPRRIRLLKSANFVYSQMQRLSSVNELFTQCKENGPPQTRSSLQASVLYTGDNPSTCSLGQQILEAIAQRKETVRAESSVQQQTHDEPGEEDMRMKARAHTDTFAELAGIEEADNVSHAEESYLEGEGQQEFEEVSSDTMLTGGYDPLKISFTMLRPPRSCAGQESGMNEGEPNILVLCQVGDGSPDEGANSKSPSRVRDSTSSLLDLYGTSDHHSSSIMEVGSRQIQLRSAPVARRAGHRLVKLVDGAIFIPRYGESAGRASISYESSHLGSGRNSRSSASYGCTRTPHNTSSGHGWLSRVRSLFTRNHQSKQSSQNCQSIGSTVSLHATDMTNISVSYEESVNERFAAPCKLVKRSAYNFALDGAFDAEIASPSKSPVNLNKELPPCPPGAHEQQPLSIRTTAPSFTYSQDTTDRPSTASTASSKLSSKSSKKGFRSVTRGLIYPDMAGHFIDLSPLPEPELSLDPAKYDPLDTPGVPQSPMSFTSVAKANPFWDEQHDPMPQLPHTPRTPHMPPPLLITKAKEPSKGEEANDMPQSSDRPKPNPTSVTRKPTPGTFVLRPEVAHKVSSPPGATMKDQAETPSRGRLAYRPTTPKRALQAVNENEVLNEPKLSRKRSKSPVKRLFGLGKSTSLKDIPGEPRAAAKKEHEDSDRKIGQSSWSNKIRHGFLTIEPKAMISPPKSEAKSFPPTPHSTFPVSLDPPYQAKIYSEIELMICVTANSFLMQQYRAGRMSKESVAKVNNEWTSKNRPQVIEFQYDQATQRDLVMHNLNTFEFHGESAQNPIVLNATMYAWKTMSSEMKVRTFCTPDSVVRKHMHDTHKILEMLGAPLVTFLAFQDTQVKTLARITEEQKRRLARKMDQERSKEVVGTPSRTKPQHAKSASEGAAVVRSPFRSAT